MAAAVLAASVIVFDDPVCTVALLPASVMVRLALPLARPTRRSGACFAGWAAVTDALADLAEAGAWRAMAGAVADSTNVPTSAANKNLRIPYTPFTIATNS